MLKGFLIVPAPAVHFCPFTISFLVPTQAHLYNPAAGRFGKLILSESDLWAPAQTLLTAKVQGRRRRPSRGREMPCTAPALLLCPGTGTPHAPAESCQQHGRGRALKTRDGTTSTLLEWKTPPHCFDPGFHY